eukprot:TRINITY_DN9859_c3_g1_i1.p1 TRINITY_DN9859_c3_g1~~TRINITY_DN9859_c3_g1_i1.p1  ORF type:complete len:363 (-),score=49.69 TRINITY_DN9859_c3_g1_i1:195-1283(-)
MYREFFCNHEWLVWSWLGMLVIGGGTWYQVMLDVQINTWFGGFYDLLQKALAKPDAVSEDELYDFLFTFARIAAIYVLVAVLLGFFTKHWTFRWRQAMNDAYLRHWPDLRHIEGASQRVQEDARRYAVMVEGIGASFLNALITLVAFLPILWDLSKSVERIPFLGQVDHAMVWLTLIWALFGTVGLAAVGIRLPGLEFQNQLVEAAFRKELVYGEDNALRAQPETTDKLFVDVRASYFNLYLNFMYFDIAKWSYLQFGDILPYVALVPSMAAATITFGQMTRLTNAFNRVQSSFQFLVRNWATIVELISVQKRLYAFSGHISEASESSGTVSRENSFAEADNSNFEMKQKLLKEKHQRVGCC